MNSEKEKILALKEEYEKSIRHLEERIAYFEEKQDTFMEGYFNGKLNQVNAIITELEELLK